MDRPLRISDPARAKLKEIWHYYADISEELADRIVHRLRLKISQLRLHPEFGRPRPEFNLPDLRSVAVRPHVIFYSVSPGSAIVIHHVTDGRRDLTTFFQDEQS